MVFSRDGEPLRYVQDVLMAQAFELQQVIGLSAGTNGVGKEGGKCHCHVDVLNKGSSVVVPVLQAVNINAKQSEDKEYFIVTKLRNSGDLCDQCHISHLSFLIWLL